MTDFIPPFPPRPPKTLGPLDTIKTLRNDLLSFWPEKAFSRNFISINILTRSINIANSPEAVEHVLVTNAANYGRKSGLMRNTLSPLLAEGLLISDGDIWQKHSALLRPFFNAEQLAKFSTVMIQTLEAHRESWANKTSVKVLPDMKTLSATLLCRIIFGENITAAHCQEFMQGVDAYIAAIEDLDINTFFGLPSWVPSFGGNKTTKTAKAVHACADKLISEYGKSADGSLLGLFMDLPKGSLSGEEIRNEILSFFLGGYESTANTLAWAWYLIAQCPDVEQHLHEEINAVLANNTASLSDVPHLTYTRAIIDETLRLYPPFPMLSREAKADDSFQNRNIPAGSLMLIVPWLLHRHKNIWEKPDHFIPERFLPDAPIKPAAYSYLPFSLGARECIAKYFATTQLTLCLAILAQQSRLQTSPGQTVKPICKIMLRPDNDLPMDIVKR
jgi:cytochrome P450